MSKSLDGMPLDDDDDDDVVVGLKAKSAPDMAMVHPPIVLPCEACICIHGPRWKDSSMLWAELRPAQEVVLVADGAPNEAEARLPSAFSDPATRHDISPMCWWHWLPRVVSGPMHVVEYTLDFAA